MEKKYYKKEYYIEFEIKSGDLPYIMQSKWFSKPQYALMWLKENITYIEENEIKVYIMEADYINEEEFDVNQFCQIINYQMIF